MNKLELYRDENAKGYDNLRYTDRSDVYIEGFDAAIELNLPIKFLEWKSMNIVEFMEVIPSFKWRYMGATYTTEELYNHWIENVFKIE